MDNPFAEAIKNYTKYLALDYSKKLDNGDLLKNSAEALLKTDIRKTDLDLILQKKYLMKKVAEDLLMQYQNMAYTKKYDCHPVLNVYCRLAFELIFEYWDKKPNPDLLPYLRDIISYEKQKTGSEKLDKYLSLYRESKKHVLKFPDF